MTTQHDAVPDKDSSAPKVVTFPYVGRVTVGYRFSPNEDLSGIALCAESRFMSESNKHTFFVCGVVCSTTNGFSCVSDMLRGRIHNDVSPSEHTTPRRTAPLC